MEKIEGMSWPKGVLISIDQLGNALSAGNPDATISARVGHFAENATSRFKYYWKFLEAVIDFTFYPVDGPNHCAEALKNEDETFQPGSDIARIILCTIVLLFCLLIAIVLRIAVFFFPKWHWKNKDRYKR